ncbi:ScbA/BarX family gamma-butyrolactone biosynthesis protein [Streptomyces sp. SID13726]|uniref:ScbA/BarX family gamma-butyrolactone biosynthesis protein n=1 Tax=Streptomyces sp. SID13726 TaxID=2706058 RepID=UPI0013B71A81|nr:ScbA/BarX family gamma-butyrolactone biosynthesis protein [Streptomyces sp. SID13726]NEA97863.1 A-factor biosynthesis protein [Streptomyces sp. SID13726]
MPESRQSTESPAGPRPLTATVPRELVHRAAVAETFITGWTGTATDRCTVAAQWPRAHQLHVSPDRSAYEPLLVAETVRQGAAVLCHTIHGARLDQHFVLHELSVDVRPEHLAVGAVPAAPVLDMVASDVRRRAGRPVGLRYDAVVRLGGECVGTGGLAVTWMNEPVYRRLRGGRTAAGVSAQPLPPALPPAAVGRDQAVDVVLSPAGRPDRWRLRIDTAHPFFFDHPLEHVPGMLLLEAARQAVRVHGGAEGREPVSFRAVFHQFTELDLPVWVEVSDAGGTDVQVTASQGDSVVFECRVRAAVA